VGLRSALAHRRREPRARKRNDRVDSKAAVLREGFDDGFLEDECIGALATLDSTLEGARRVVRDVEPVPSRSLEFTLQLTEDRLHDGWTHQLHVRGVRDMRVPERAEDRDDPES